LVKGGVALAAHALQTWLGLLKVAPHWVSGSVKSFVGLLKAMSHCVTDWGSWLKVGITPAMHRWVRMSIKGSITLAVHYRLGRKVAW